MTAEEASTTRGARLTARGVDRERLAADLAAAVTGEVRFDEGSRALYATDASNYRQVPLGVVIPRTEDDVLAALAICRRHDAPVFSRGGGTSLAGQCCNLGVAFDFSKYLNRVLEIDAEARTATVQPGCVLDDLRAAAAEHGLTFGPDPSTHAWCTLGGMAGNDSCGIHSVMAGPRTADMTVEMDVVTYDGLRLTVGATSAARLEQYCRREDRTGEIYRGLRALREEHAERIRRRYPAIPRRVSGYNLDELLPEKGFHVARALVGSEATCVTILRLKVKLVPLPAARSLLVLGYPSVYEAADHVVEVMDAGPIGLEGIDHRLVEDMGQKHLHTRSVGLLPEGEGWLLVEFGGDSKDDADGKAHRLMDRLAGADDAPSMRLYDDEESESRVWEARESGLGATANLPGRSRTWPGWEDAGVPPSRLGEYLRSFRKLLQESGYEAALYGHFGQGCVHCRIDFDLRTEPGLDRYRRFIAKAADLVVSVGGSLSGEHGDGQARGALLERMYGAELIAAFHGFKSLWDPAWRMNPGKVIDADSPTTNLRLGLDYRPAPTPTHFQFPDDDGSFADATLRCVGVGKCRRRHEAFMCPSFLATHDEKDTTRGRAHMLFEMFRGDHIRDGWRSEAVKDALDLCLGCKGCKNDCPVSVDMAMYKSEFLAHHYEGRLYPRTAYAMGMIDRWARLGALAPGLANFVGHTRPFSTLLKRAIGMAPRRTVPSFAQETFTHWYRHREPGPAATRGRVLVYPDPFNEYFFPGTLRALVQVLERLGYATEIPDERLPGLRPLIHFGMLDRAKDALARAVRILRPWAVDGVPIVGMEPSTVSVYRTDGPALAPHDEDLHRVSDLTRLLSEFLDDEDIALPRLPGRKAILHAHCHHKAVLGVDALLSVLETRMGLDIAQPEAGCCGMAGAFGYEDGHYDVSQAIGEARLLPAVRRAAPGVLVIADGFSCREQIQAGTGRQALTLPEVILAAWEPGRLTVPNPASDADESSMSPSELQARG